MHLRSRIMSRIAAIRSIRFTRKVTVLAAIAAAVVAGGSIASGVALASSSGSTGIPTYTGPYTYCATDHQLVIYQTSTANSGSCSGYDSKWVNVGGNGPAGPAGPQGPAGPAGPAGATGPQGTSGVVSTSVTDLGSVSSVATGGGFVANATQVGTITLEPGTYLVDISAKATPNAVTTGAVFPQFFVYNQPANSDFSGDLFNVGSGALEQATAAELASDPIDSYYSGTGEITLSVKTTLHVYAFGYDSDTGAGSYTLDDLSATVTQLQPSG